MADEKKPKAVVKTKEEAKEVNGAKRTISSKTVLIAVCIVLAIVLVIVYIYKWQGIKDTEKFNKSYLLDSGSVSLKINSLEEVQQTLAESPTEYFVLITYSGTEETYNLEKGIKQIIDKYKLNDSFYYLNIENNKDDNNYLEKINKAFNTDQIKKVPIILYYKNGTLINTVKRNDDNCITAGDFQKLLDIYEIEGQ